MTPFIFNRASAHLRKLLQISPIEDLVDRRESSRSKEATPLPRSIFASDTAVRRRWDVLDNEAARAELFDETAAAALEIYGSNIENYIGTVRMPVGIAGPLRVNGLFAQGNFYVPLATTEAALVASYSRGAQVITASGGCTAMLLHEGVTRSPGFIFNSLSESGAFVNWLMQQMGVIKQVGEQTTKHGSLSDVRFSIEGNHVYMIIEFETADAAGQNMVTIATDAICKYIAEHAPVRPRRWFVEANHCGDKKISAGSYLNVRGKKVSAEVVLPAGEVRRFLHGTPEEIHEYWQMGGIGGVLSGAVGMQAHYANGLAALYIACGQDAACVAESAVGLTRIDVTETGDLYAAVTLPNLIVGTVGGGTTLPTQHACLSLLGLAGPGKARAFAEVTAAVILAGELSIMGAISAGHFSGAHRKLARGRKQVPL